jgi:hypothetical protein
MLGMYFHGELNKELPPAGKNQIPVPVHSGALYLQGDWDCMGVGRGMQISAGAHWTDTLVIIWRDPITQVQLGQTGCRLTDAGMLVVTSNWPSNDILNRFHIPMPGQARISQTDSKLQIAWVNGPICQKVS